MGLIGPTAWRLADGWNGLVQSIRKPPLLHLATKMAQIQLVGYSALLDDDQ